MIAALVKRGATILLVTVCVLLFGAATYISLPREASPDIEIPFVMVTSIWLVQARVLSPRPNPPICAPTSSTAGNAASDRGPRHRL